MSIVHKTLKSKSHNAARGPEGEHDVAGDTEIREQQLRDEIASLERTLNELAARLSEAEQALEQQKEANTRLTQAAEDQAKRLEAEIRQLKSVRPTASGAMVSQHTGLDPSRAQPSLLRQARAESNRRR